MGSGSVLGAAAAQSLVGGGAGGMNSQSVPAIGGGAYKYGSSSGIGAQVGTLGGAPQYNFGSIPKYSSSGIAGGIG